VEEVESRILTNPTVPIEFKQHNHGAESEELHMGRLAKWFVTVLLTFLPASAQSCQSALATLQRGDTIAAFGYASGPGFFMDLVKNSSVGKALAGCPSLADTAWDTILKAGRDGLKTMPDAFDSDRIAVLLTVYGEQMNPAHFEKLKEFVRLKPWEHGFSFASDIAVDALLAYKKDPSRDIRYHSYTPAQMEAALQKYGR
jgi:hypothetical protein